MRIFFENVIKYLTWAANYFLLANIVLHLYKILIPENILTALSGSLSLPMRLLAGLVVHFVFFLMITVGSLSLSGLITKIICMDILKFKTLNAEDFKFNLPDFKEKELTVEEKYNLEKLRKEKEEKERKEKRKSLEKKFNNIVDEIWTLESKLDRIKIGNSIFDTGSEILSKSELRHNQEIYERIRDKMDRLQYELEKTGEEVEELGGYRNYSKYDKY